MVKNDYVAMFEGSEVPDNDEPDQKFSHLLEDLFLYY